MNKEKIEWGVAIIFACLFLLVVFYVVPSIIKDEFNPEEDKCLEYKDVYDTVWYPNDCDHIENHFEKELCWINCNNEMIKSCSGDRAWVGIECSDWIPKNKCQLDPNSEECVCDEYVFNNIPHGCKQVGNTVECDDSFELTYEKMNSDLFEEECIKAHLGDEE